MVDINNALALAVRPVDFDISKPLMAASQLRGADTQNQLAQMQLANAGERRNDLAAFKTSGDVNALRGQPDIYAQIVQTRSALDENKRKEFDFAHLAAARDAQYVASIPDGPERTRAWQERLDLARKEGRIDPSTYQRLAATPPSDLLLRHVILGGTSIENAITLEQKDKDRAAGLDFSRGISDVLRPGAAPAASAAAAPTGSMFGGLKGWAPGERPMDMGPAPVASAAAPAPGAPAAAPPAAAPIAPAPMAPTVPASPAAPLPVPSAPPVSTAPPASMAIPGSAPLAPPGALPSPVAPGAAPAVGDVTTRLHALIPVLAMAMGNPGLPKETREQAGKLLDTALSDSKATDVQKNYYNSYVPQETAAGRTPKSMFEYEKDLAEAKRAQVNIDQKGESKFSEELGKGLAKQFNEMAEDGIKAADDRLLYGRLGSLLEQSGTGSSIAFTNWVRANTGIKLSPKADVAEAADSLVNYLKPRMRVAGTGASSDKDLDAFGKAIPSLMSTPEGKRIIVETLGGMATARQERGDIAMRVQMGEIKPKEAIAEIRALGDPFKSFRDYQADRAGAAGRQSPETKLPAIGDVIDGFRFNGGNPAQPESWDKVQ